MELPRLCPLPALHWDSSAGCYSSQETCWDSVGQVGSFSPYLRHLHSQRGKAGWQLSCHLGMGEFQRSLIFIFDSHSTFTSITRILKNYPFLKLPLGHPLWGLWSCCSHTAVQDPSLHIASAFCNSTNIHPHSTREDSTGGPGKLGYMPTWRQVSHLSDWEKETWERYWGIIQSATMSQNRNLSLSW